MIQIQLLRGKEAFVPYDEELQKYFQISVFASEIENGKIKINTDQKMGIEPCKRSNFLFYEDLLDDHVDKRLCISNWNKTKMMYENRSNMKYFTIDIKECDSRKNDKCV